MSKLRIFRALWGLDCSTPLNALNVLKIVKQEGYQGIEIAI
jgi:hypothetical protein